MSAGKGSGDHASQEPKTPRKRANTSRTVAEADQAEQFMDETQFVEQLASIQETLKDIDDKYKQEINFNPVSHVIDILASPSKKELKEKRRQLEKWKNDINECMKTIVSGTCIGFTFDGVTKK